MGVGRDFTCVRNRPLVSEATLPLGPWRSAAGSTWLPVCKHLRRNFSMIWGLSPFRTADSLRKRAHSAVRLRPLISPDCV